MYYFLLFVIIIAVGVQSIFRKEFNIKTDGAQSAPYVFNLLAAAAAVIFLMFFGLADYTFHLPTLIYSLFFGAMFEVAVVTILYALMYGSLSLTSLLLSYSIILPAIYGILFLGEPFRITTAVGLLLLVVSLYLFNKKNETLKITKKWLFYITLLFISNGACSIIMKVHAVKYPDMYQTEFLGTAMLFVALINAVILIFVKKGGIGNAFRRGCYLAAPNGICNVGANLLLMMLSSAIPASIVFPVVAAGGIVTAYVISRFMYKEKMSAIQNIAFIISLISITVLNL